MDNGGIYHSLPKPLLERTRLVGPNQVPSRGEFVLYWMRAAIRTDENPALNVAIELANRLELPLLVYQGLSERYPFASDRHHTFVLQGARDVQLEMARRNLPYALHVERSGHRGPHLKTLAQNASSVVTEDMPTEPLRSWTLSLSRKISGALVVVDTACVVPMRLVGRSYERAFEYRDATRDLYSQRVSVPPNDSVLGNSVFGTNGRASIDLPFEPIDLQDCDIASLVGQCEIDHSIGPVSHSPGGSIAGYRRWQEFRNKGLSSYARRRNDVVDDGVSRMSPYLHYGMVAPTRIAREATADQSAGAEKFLDELLIWRELSYAFCHYRRDHGRVSAIPNWARETLREHKRDSRDLLSWETMARGRTGDSIWDAAQRSLLMHGELHNNVRMTWGKAVLKWTPDAKRALARLIDLNHRYALDGRDPASYGGILWCLGQFDRPFSPVQPVYGTVRNRPTDQHAKRIDSIAYQRKVTRPLWNPVPKVAVIGAGISGLTCARTLADHGCDVSVFDKSRGVSGRMSTRRLEDAISFDHGAQYFTARDGRFKRYVESWIDDGIVQRWDGRIVAVEKGVVYSEKVGDQRFVAVPGMSALGKHLASDLKMCLGAQVVAPERANDKWQLATDDGSDLGEFDYVVVAVPSHQATSLLVNAPGLAEQASGVKMNGCWAVMLAFEQSLNIGFDGAFVQQSPLSWIARNNSKPGRNGDRETWVLHADAEWTEAHMEDSPGAIESFLIAEFFRAVGGINVEPSYSAIHRWRFAIPQDPLSADCLLDVQRNIGACGDWCGGPRVEGAFLSGMAIAGRILGQMNMNAAPLLRMDQQLDLF
ncbi:FAD-dependent oxidoreductase [Rubripirellula reticaptiva]|uniref:Deoxyribodipyrimidine photo-lyase n=1 Tax=Rubripirellula reticaptiva TaxID=2528013 RepID=A0A5C6F835_9BACT|nr:FAD-dependent oxidoreductase [Rubripirellula reticaptiva]TWU56266.1 Deoxyribodipyrimidine photo-lyase [Rubripirellula reticaptiva]